MTILFLESLSWRSGAQRILEAVLDAIIPDFEPLVAFPDDGPFCKKLQDRGIKTLLYPLGSYRSGQKSYAEMVAFSVRSLVCGLKLAGLIRRSNVRLVYVNGPRSLPAGVLAARLTGCPVLFHLHLTLCRKEEVALVAHLARYVAKIIACSHATAQPLRKANPALDPKIEVLYTPAPKIPSGVQPLVEAQEDPAGFTLGMVGRITESKGQWQLLSSVGKLASQTRERIRLVFVGAPSAGDTADLAYAQRLKECASQLNLQDKITWAGYQADPGPFYSSMDVLVQPSSHQAGEGMPSSILEAFSKGIPAIASRTGGIPEIIQDGVNGLLFPPGDEDALALALQRFLGDGSLRARLRAGARATVTRQFSIEKFQARIRALVQEVSE